MKPSLIDLSPSLLFLVCAVITVSLMDPRRTLGDRLDDELTTKFTLNKRVFDHLEAQSEIPTLAHFLANFIFFFSLFSYQSKLDLRGDTCMPPIKNQGKCTNGDWAFATVTPLEYSYCKKHNGKLTLFSEQQFLDCMQTQNCKGGNPSNAYHYLSNGNGKWISHAASYPLTSDHTGIKGTCKEREETGKNKTWRLVFLLEGGTSEIIDALYQYGPVTSTVWVTSDLFDSYAESDGIYNDPNCDAQSLGLQQRSMVIVGYGHDSSSGSDYWILRGSFGTDWGIDGHMYFPRGVNYCKIESSSFFATAN